MGCDRRTASFLLPPPGGEVVREILSELEIAEADNTRLRASLAAAESVNKELREALEKSVQLQSHYAALLNTYDAGERIGFASADDWLKRLSTLPKQDSEGSDTEKEK